MPLELQNINLFVPYLVIGVLAVNILLLAVFLLVTLFFFKKMALSEEERKKIKQQAHTEAATLLDDARKQALKIVSAAQDKAEEVLRDVKIFAGNSEERLNKLLEDFYRREIESITKTSEKLIVYQDIIGEAEKKHLKDMAEAFRKSTEAIERGASEFHRALGEEMAKSHADADRRIQEWHESAAKEIEDYRQEALHKIDKAVYRVLALVSREVIGKTIDAETHRSLVLKALEEAKKEGFFNA